MNKWRDIMQGARNRLGLKQGGVAHTLKVDPSTIRNIERSAPHGLVSVARYMEAVSMPDEQRLALLKLVGGAQ